MFQSILNDSNYHTCSLNEKVCTINEITYFFRLIVVAEKQIVYSDFPIPLINRLEKHFLSLNTMLTQAQLELADKLQNWVQLFCEVKVPAYLRQK